MFLNRFSLSDERYNNHKNKDFHSCEHCVEYYNHCKKLERKLKIRRSGWSYQDETSCETWTKIQ